VISAVRRAPAVIRIHTKGRRAAELYRSQSGDYGGTSKQDLAHGGLSLPVKPVGLPLSTYIICIIKGDNGPWRSEAGSTRRILIDPSSIFRATAAGIYQVAGRRRGRLHRCVLPDQQPGLRATATDNGRLDGKPVRLSVEDWERKKRDQRSTISAQMLARQAL
jgi:hypothetical protein